MNNHLRRIAESLSELNRARRLRRREKLRRNRPTGLCVLAIMKNESMNIDEWITHYLQVGADRICLIDNGSTDETVAKANAWVTKGVVELILRPQQHRQLAHYWTAIRHFRLRETFEWLLIADLDEFWFCPDGRSIPSVLAEPQFGQLDVIYANWRMFGSSGLIDHPASIRRSLVHCNPRLFDHRTTKFICRTSVLKSRRSLTEHRICGADSSRTVSDNETFHLFHYPIQSLEYFKRVKMIRGDVASVSSDTVRDLAYFSSYDAPCTVLNRTLAYLVEQDLLDRGCQ
jgi:hypothetical protein